MAKDINMKRAAMLILSIVLISIQTFIIGFVVNQGVGLTKATAEIRDHRAQYSQLLFEQIVLPQMTRQLQQVRSAWMTLTQTYSYPILSNSVIDKSSLQLFLETSVRGVRAFGIQGDAFVYDSLTGDYYMEYSPNVVKTDEPLNINTIHSNPGSKNPVGSKAFFSDLSWRSDILNHDFLINLWETPDVCYNDAYDFTRYPLGTLKREFVQKVMLPSPAAGTRQVVVVLSVEEKDITDYLDSFAARDNNIIEGMNRTATNLAVSVIACIFFSVILIVVTNYMLVRAVCTYNGSSR